MRKSPNGKRHELLFVCRDIRAKHDRFDRSRILNNIESLMPVYAKQ